MIAGIFVVLVISTLSMSYLQISMDRSRENSSSVDSKRAFYMAEAGLAEGYAALTGGKSGVVASADQPAVYGNGVFWVEATPLSATRTQLRSTGLSGVGRDSLTIVVERTTRTLAEYGIFGDEGVRVGIGASIETYDSRVTPADPAPLPIPVLDHVSGDVFFSSETSRLRVGSNGDITFVGDRSVARTIDGDVVPGPTGSVVTGPGVSILGSTAPAAETVSLNTISAPAVLRDAGSFGWNSPGETYKHEAAIVAYNNLVVGAGTVIIQGPAKIAINQLTVASGAELKFDTSNGPVRMYVSSGMNFASGSTLSSTDQDPTQLMIAVGASDSVSAEGDDIQAVNLGASGEFYGFIYSPHADLTLRSDLDYYGSMIAKEILIAPNATLNFDEALLDFTADGSRIVSDMISWRFVELPQAEIVQKRIDPIKWMQIKGKTLVKPSESHDDDWDGEVDASDRLANRLKEAIVN